MVVEFLGHPLALSSSSSGPTSSPGISTPKSRPTRLSWVKSLSSAFPAPGILDLDRDLAAVPPDRT